MSFIPEIGGVSGKDNARNIQQQEAKEQQLLSQARQVGSEESLTQTKEGMSFVPREKKEFKTLKERLTEPPRTQPKTPTEKKPDGPQRAEKPSDTQRAERFSESTSADAIAERYNKQNPELKPKTLLILQNRIPEAATEEEIQQLVDDIYADKALADEAIDFLIEVAENKKMLRNKLINAKQKFNSHYGVEIRAGRNISAQARLYSTRGLGSPTALREFYSDLVKNPRTSQDLFDELTEKFKFSDMKNMIDFILHSLGDDLKSGGSSIAKGELQALMGESKSMQAILGLFRFFHSRMSLIKKAFAQKDLSMPSRMTFELLARVIMKFLKERYPSSDKVLKLGYLLGISDELEAQMIVFMQYRDAMRNLSPLLFLSERHRQEVLMVLMETLSDLEDELDEEEEDEEES